jgi:hypothetical protein
MASDRDMVRGSLDTVPEWRLTRPMDVPGQAIESADYVLIAEIVDIERWQQQAERLVQGLADDSAHLVSSRKMLVLQRILEMHAQLRAIALLSQPEQAFARRRVGPRGNQDSALRPGDCGPLTGSTRVIPRRCPSDPY